MTIHLDHVLVPVRDRRAGAERLATLLGVPWGASAAGPFHAVYVNDGLTLERPQPDPCGIPAPPSAPPRAPRSTPPPALPSAPG